MAGGRACRRPAHAGGSLTVTGTKIDTNNGGQFGGGGIQNGGPMNISGFVLVMSSTVFGNVTTNEGGGIFSGQNGHPAGPGRSGVAPHREAGSSPPGYRNGAWGASCRRRAGQAPCGVRPGGCGVTPPVADRGMGAVPSVPG